MIIGVGIDIVDLESFRSRLSAELIEELYLPGEIAYAQTQARSWENFAARLAVKEAAFKALGAGLEQGLRWKDVELCRQDSGAIEVCLHGRAAELAEKKGMSGCVVSLSHSRNTSVAVVIIEGDDL